MSTHHDRFYRLLRAGLLLLLLALGLVGCGGGGALLPEDADFDGILDINDPFPGDTDNDGLPNGDDPDDDNDGVADPQDAFPFDPTEWVDSDGDGLGNNADPDDDNDGVVDSSDRFPLDGAEWIDADGDGIGDNADPDDDNDGVVDVIDTASLNAAVSGDIDGDGVDNLIDGDIDGDGYPNELEKSEGTDPFTAGSTPPDADGDKITDREEGELGSNPFAADSDADGLGDFTERILGSGLTKADTDGDGLGDGVEAGGDLAHLPDYDGDGIPDLLDCQRAIPFAFEPVEPAAEPYRYGGAWNPAGTQLYVADPVKHVVHILDAAGAKLGALTGGEPLFYSPNDVAVDETGQIYVCDTGNHQIQVFSAVGGFLYTIGELGQKLGQFALPRGLAVNGADLFVADTLNHRVQRFGLAKKNPLMSIGGEGSGVGQLKFPKDVAVDNQGRIIVADSGNYRVQIFSSAGVFMQEITAESLGLGVYDAFAPVGVAVGSTGELFVTDEAGHRVVVLRPDGTLARIFGGFGNSLGVFEFPGGVALSGNGQLLVVDRFRAQVF